MAGPHTSGYKGTGGIIGVGRDNKLGLDGPPPSKKRRIVLGLVFLTLGVSTVVGWATLAWWYAPFLVIGALLVVIGLSELRKGV